MRVRRSLLLGIGGMLLGGMAVQSAFSFGAFPSPATSTNVSVVSPQTDADVNLKNHVPAIAANNVYHKVDDIWVSEYDPNYQLELLSLQVIFNGIQSAATCGVWDYQLSNGSDLAPAIGLVFNGINVDTGYDLQLRIATAGTNALCKVSSGIIQATFQATGF